VTPIRFIIAALSGLAAGVLSGALGVGGGILAQPALRLLLGAREIVAVATPLPMILPTALTGALTYRKAGEVDLRAAGWMALPGGLGAIAGALLTKVVEPGVLLVLTAALLAWQSANVIRGGRVHEVAPHNVPGWRFAVLGLGAGTLSGLLGIGGGLIMVPVLAGFVGMPLKRALGTSLVAIVAIVVPGTVVHAILGHVHWGLFLALTLGAVPGARIGARLALAAREHRLRVFVGSAMMALAGFYGLRELVLLLQG